MCLRLNSIPQYSSALQLFTILIVFALVLVLAYFVTKWIAGAQKGKGGGRNIEVLETYRLSPSRFIAIVRIGSRYVAIATGKDDVSLLCELDKDDLDFPPAQVGGGDLFKSLLKKFNKGNKTGE